MKNNSATTKSKFLVLLGAQFKNQSSLNLIRNGHDKRAKSRARGKAVALGIVGLMLIVYSFMISLAYCHVGIGEAVPSMSMAVSSIVVFIFTFVKTNGYLFAFRDFDMLMSLPFKTHTVVAVKFLYMYIFNMAFSLCMMISMAVGYGIIMRPSPLVYVMWFVSSLFAPLIPMCLASLLGSLAAAISTKFRFKVLAQVLLSLALVILVFAGNTYLGSSNMSGDEFLNGIESIGNLIRQKLYGLYPPSKWFDMSVNDTNILACIGYLALSVLVFVIFLALISFRYNAVNSKLMASSRKNNYKISSMQKSSVLFAIVRKELKRLFSSVPYIMNVGMGLILAVLASAAAAIMGIDKVTEILSIGSISEKVIPAVPFGVSVMLTMTCTTAVSLSLEGKNLWILKSLPISDAAIFNGKMLFNLILVAPAGLVCALCLAFALNVSPIMYLIYVLAVLSAVLFSTVFGMLMGIKFVNFSWTNEIEVIKQGTASMVGIFSNMLLQVLLTVGVIFFSTYVDAQLVTVGFSALLLIASVILYSRVKRCKISA